MRFRFWRHWRCEGEDSPPPAIAKTFILTSFLLMSVHPRGLLDRHSLLESCGRSCRWFDCLFERFSRILICSAACACCVLSFEGLQRHDQQALLPRPGPSASRVSSSPKPILRIFVQPEHGAASASLKTASQGQVALRLQTKRSAVKKAKLLWKVVHNHLLSGLRIIVCSVSVFRLVITKA